MHPFHAARTSTGRYGTSLTRQSRHVFKSRFSNQITLFATSTTKSTTCRVWQYPASNESDAKNRGVLFLRDEEKATEWKAQTKRRDEISNLSTASRQAISHFLPAKYPTSVASGYFKFAAYSFTASIAGSASMVLSTQTLLLAVGVIGSHAQAGIMAGAFNWVMKDFVGQVGGVLFASQMGKTRAFDSDPKRWRMVSAMTLDGATLLEILAPLFQASMVLPIASVANVSKNIGFLTASASRAAIHQSLAISGNLGDVTAKSGSQAMVASLVGTSLGIGLSSILAHDTYMFGLGFCGLAAIHQGCNYLSLHHVPLTHFNRQRLQIVINHFLETKEVLDPKDVADQERFLPLIHRHVDEEWLSIGSPLTTICPDASDLDTMLKAAPGESYILRHTKERTHLVFLKQAHGGDIIRGVLHACLVWQQASITTHGTLGLVHDAHLKTLQVFPAFLEEVQRKGWKTATESTSIESRKSYRLRLSGGTS